MTQVVTKFTDHDTAVEWAEKQGYTVIMASLKDGFVSLMVTGGNTMKTSHATKYYTSREAGRVADKTYVECNHHECRYSSCEKFIYSHTDNGVSYFIDAKNIQGSK